MMALGDRLVLADLDQGLVASDGTGQGRQVLAAASPLWGDLPPFRKVGERLFVGNLYSAGSFGPALWVTDGTPAGTALVADVPVEDMEAFQGLLYFASEGSLWRSDGTPQGTEKVATAMGSASDLTAVGGQLFFSACDATHGQELWVSDGTTDGTRRVSDLWPGS